MLLSHLIEEVHETVSTKRTGSPMSITSTSTASEQDESSMSESEGLEERVTRPFFSRNDTPRRPRKRRRIRKPSKGVDLDSSKGSFNGASFNCSGISAGGLNCSEADIVETTEGNLKKYFEEKLNRSPGRQSPRRVTNADKILKGTRQKVIKTCQEGIDTGYTSSDSVESTLSDVLLAYDEGLRALRKLRMPNLAGPVGPQSPQEGASKPAQTRTPPGGAPVGQLDRKATKTPPTSSCVGPFARPPDAPRKTVYPPNGVNLKKHYYSTTTNGKKKFLDESIVRGTPRGFRDTPRGYESNINLALRGEFCDLPLREVIKLPLHALRDMREEHIQLLSEFFNVRTIEQLGRCKLFKIPSAIQTLAEYESPSRRMSCKQNIDEAMSPPYQRLSYSSMLDQKLDALKGFGRPKGNSYTKRFVPSWSMSAANEQSVKDALIKDLAGNRFAELAQALVELAQYEREL